MAKLIIRSFVPKTVTFTIAVFTLEMLELDPKLLITIRLISTVCLALSLVLLHIIYRVCDKDSSKWIDQTYRNLTVIVALSFTLSSIVDLIHIIDIYYTGVVFNTPLVIIADGLYFIGDAMFYILILMRITIPFEVNKCMVIFLSLIIVVFSITGILYCIGIYFASYRHH